MAFLSLKSPFLVIRVSLLLSTGRVPFIWEIYFLSGGDKGGAGCPCAVSQVVPIQNNKYAIVVHLGAASPAPLLVWGRNTNVKQTVHILTRWKQCTCERKRKIEKWGIDEEAIQWVLKDLKPNLITR